MTANIAVIIYQRLLGKDWMRSRGNAPMESFFRTLKVELIYWEDYVTRAEARRSIGEFIEQFYTALDARLC